MFLQTIYVPFLQIFKCLLFSGIFTYWWNTVNGIHHLKKKQASVTVPNHITHHSVTFYSICGNFVYSERFFFWKSASTSCRFKTHFSSAWVHVLTKFFECSCKSHLQQQCSQLNLRHDDAHSYPICNASSLFKLFAVNFDFWR